MARERAAPGQDEAKLDHAIEFMQAALTEYHQNRYRAAASLAAVCAFNAADALSIARLGVYNHYVHDKAPALLIEAGFPDEAKALTRVLPYKNLAQYTTEPLTRARASTCITNARTILKPAMFLIRGTDIDTATDRSPTIEQPQREHGQHRPEGSSH